jgi:hypothetical protein
MSLRKRVQNVFNEEGVQSEVDETIYGKLSERLPTRQRASITTLDNGDIQAGNMVFTAVGLDFQGDISRDEWLAAYRFAQQVRRAIWWIVADLAAYAADRWGEKYSHLSEITGYKEQSLKDMAYVARHIQLSVRTDKLTPTHHKLVAALSPATQRHYLSLGAEKGWSVGVMRYAIETGNDNPPTPSGQGDTLGASNYEKNARKLARLALTAGQGRISQKQRKAVLGYIERQRRWLEEIERMVADE